MADLARYVVKLEAETARYTRELERANRKLDRFEKNNQRSLDRIKRSFNAFGAAIAAVGVGQLTRSVASAGLEMERFERGLKVATGTQQGAAREMEFLRDTADELGLNLQSLTREYVSLAVASKGTALEGKATRDIFVAVSEAASVLGLSAEQTGGALNAIQQIISKGKVSAEELRGQLGERLPGAFQIAAKAIGVTTAELDKMLVSGKLTAEDLLPKMAEELHRTFGPEVAASAESAQAAINRFNTAIFELKVAVSDSGVLGGLASLATALGKVATGYAVLLDNKSPFSGQEAIDDAAEELEELEARFASVQAAAGRAGRELPADQFERYTAEIREARDELQDLIDAQRRMLGLAVPDRLQFFELDELPSRSEALAEIHAQLAAAGTKSGQAFGESFNLAAETTIDVNLSADRLLPELSADRVFPVSEIVEGAYAEVERATADTTADMESSFSELGSSIGFTLRNTFSDLFMGIESDFGSMLSKMAADFLSSQLVNSLMSFLPSLFSGGGGLAPITVPEFTPLAAGGPAAAGGLHLVGEQGPELFVPNVSGRIVPNHGLGGGVTIVQHNQAGLPPQWQAQMFAFTKVAAAAAKESVGRELGGRR